MARKTNDEDVNLESLQNQKIVDVGLNEQMQRSYIAYAMSVIISRALPDVRDGLKPVHRRILYDMFEANLTYENDFRKSATTVGSVLGKYHPHGDASVYDAMVRLGQDFSLRYPLVQGKGNFGSIDGDPPAAYRYTEAKMSRLAAEMLSDIGKETVDFVSNFDDSLKEPAVLPSRFPNLLVNGSEGIAVGMATKIPPHNLRETIDAIIAIIDDPEITLEEIMNYIQGPDFPTGGIIMGKSGIRRAYATGRGKIVVRAKAEIEELENGRSRIVVTEIPYQVNKLRMERHINELMRDGKLDGISSTKDTSSEKINFIINIKQNADPHIVLNNLYKYTQMQETYGMIMLALVDNQPKILNLREMLDCYIDHQVDVIERRTRYDLRKAEEHAHILEGYRIAIDNIDEVVHIIRGSASVAAAKENLIERFTLTEVQATAIVQMTLGRLTGLERDKIEEDYRKTMADIERFRDILADHSKVLSIIKEDLTRIRDRYGDDRRTEITMVTDELDIEDLIEEEDVVITLTNRGYVKRVPVDTYHSQRRGGRGITGLTTKNEDFVEHIFTTTTHSNVLFFTTRGVVYQLKGYQIPEKSRTAVGMPIVQLLPLENGEKVTAMIPVQEFSDGKFLTFVTKNGTIKKTDLTDFARIRTNGLRAIELAEGDELIRVKITDNTQHIIIATHDGMAVRFPETDVRPMGRTARGVRAIKLAPGDFVIGASVAREDSQLLIVTENGYGKKTPLEEYRIQQRGGKGIYTYKITEKTGKLVGMKAVTERDDIMLVTSDGIVIRMHSREISTYSRHTQGVKLMRLDEGVQVVSIARAEVTEEEEEESTQQ